MKPLIKLTAYFLFASSISLLLDTCKKENARESNGNSSSSQINRAPIANAGSDTTINLVSCVSSRQWN